MLRLLALSTIIGLFCMTTTTRGGNVLLATLEEHDPANSLTVNKATMLYGLTRSNPLGDQSLSMVLAPSKPGGATTVDINRNQGKAKIGIGAIAVIDFLVEPPFARPLLDHASPAGDHEGGANGENGQHAEEAADIDLMDREVLPNMWWLITFEDVEIGAEGTRVIIYTQGDQADPEKPRRIVVLLVDGAIKVSAPGLKAPIKQQSRFIVYDIERRRIDGNATFWINGAFVNADMSPDQVPERSWREFATNAANSDIVTRIESLSTETRKLEAAPLARRLRR